MMVDKSLYAGHRRQSAAVRWRADARDDGGAPPRSHGRGRKLRLLAGLASIVGSLKCLERCGGRSSSSYEDSNVSFDTFLSSSSAALEHACPSSYTNNCTPHTALPVAVALSHKCAPAPCHQRARALQGGQGRAAEWVKLKHSHMSGERRRRTRRRRS